MSWLDEHDACHLLTLDADGVARVWDGRSLAAAFHSRPLSRGPSYGATSARTPAARAESGAGAASSSRALLAGGGLHAPRLRSAFYAFPSGRDEAVSSVDGSSGEPQAAPGVTGHWLPGRMQLAVGGGRSSTVRLWDLAAQRCSGVTATGSGGRAFVTSLTSAWPGTDLLVAGMSNGHINVLDLRVASASPASPSWSRGAVVASLREHKRWIVNVSQARSGSVYALVSGSVLADVRFWDLRRSTSVRAIQAHRGAMTALAAHDFAPLIATGSQRQQVRVFTNSGDPITEFRYHEGFLGQRIGPVSCLAFHPYRLFLGSGALDSVVSIHHGSPQTDAT